MAESREEELKQQLSATIDGFNSNRVPLLKKAFEEGGDEAVRDLEREYDTLRDAYFSILKKQLDRNHHRYDELTSAALNEVSELKQDVRALANIAKIINGLSQVISLVGQVLIVLGI